MALLSAIAAAASVGGQPVNVVVSANDNGQHFLSPVCGYGGLRFWRKAELSLSRLTSAMILLGRWTSSVTGHCFCSFSAGGPYLDVG